MSSASRPPRTRRSATSRPTALPATNATTARAMVVSVPQRSRVALAPTMDQSMLPVAPVQAVAQAPHEGGEDDGDRHVDQGEGHEDLDRLVRPRLEDQRHLGQLLDAHHGPDRAGEDGLDEL